MLQSNFIYKINYLKENKIVSIHVFYGENVAVNGINLDELFKTEPSNAAFIDSVSGIPIFNSEELTYISENNIPVNFTTQQIHYDDTIGTVKLKIIQAFGNTFSLEEIYLFCLKEEIFNPVSVYQTLTQNKKLPLTRVRLDQFLSNIIRNEQGEPIKFDIPDKEVYDYDDIITLQLEAKKLWVSKVLGQKFFILTNEYPYIYNPYDVNNYDEFIERVSRKSLTTLNSHLLLNTGPIVENNIYLCLAADVLEYLKNKDISETTTMKLYYPFLYKNNIQSLANLQDKKYELLEKNKPLLTSETMETFQTVDLFYDIYKDRTSELKYQYKGVKIIKVIMHSDIIVKMPLEVIFKLVHATETNPLIKYNPSTRQENVYRLFADKLSTDGRKIPFLNKANIIKLMKTIGRSRSVSVYIEYLNGTNTETIICEFEENGNITISCEFEKIMNLSDITTIFKDAVNPVIEEVKSYFEENGYKISLFESLFDENVEVKQITYQSVVEIDNTINVTNIIGCLSCIFIVESVGDAGKNIEMRYKRVANFNKKTSQEAFVIEQANQKNGLRGEELITALSKNYNMKPGEAAELLAKMVNELQVERGVKRNDIEIKINPGFKTRVTVNPITSLALIEIENINDIQYLSLIPIYIDTFIRLTQDRGSTKVPSERIQQLCDTTEREEIVLDDIIAASEEVFPEQEEPESFLSDESEIPSLDKNKKSKNVLDLLFDDDEEDEEEEKSGATLSSRGGQGSTSSNSKSKTESDSEFPDLDNIKGLEQLESEPSSSNEIVIPNEEPVASLVAKLVAKPNVPIKPSVTTSVKNIDGMKLANPTPFFKSMEERDPVLFLRENKGKFNAYSRTCPAANRRQPIILTDTELNKIDTEMPGFLKEGDVLKYGSNPDKKFNYICPRYWCLKTNLPIDPSEIVDGKHPTCGNVIPRDAQEVPKGAYIYEFFSPPAHGTREKYKDHKPGFVADGKHPDGYCIPCCFSNWNKKSQITRRQECTQTLSKEVPQKLVLKENKKDKKSKKDKKGKKKEKGEKDDEEEEEQEEEQDEEEEQEDEEQEKDVQRIVSEKEEYIKGPEKFPLDSGRWGYLPAAIQIILRESNADCQVSKTNTNIKPFHNCLLRHGVQESQAQSFIACIADAKFYGESTVPTIDKMKENIIASITLDTFITYQNGNLLTSFMTDTDFENVNIDLTPFSKTKIYSKIDPKNKEQLYYFKKIVVSFKNFITFLRDPTSIIDYTYLWDIICRPNTAIFAQGINLVILEIPEDDTTNNVELICPTNHYSNEYYEARKQTLILMHKGDFFEPLYSYRNEETKLKISKTFSEYDPQLSKTMRAVFKQIIKPLIYNTCVPLASMPSIYKFKSPILLAVLIDNIHKINYEVVTQVVNYNTKVIGLVIVNMETQVRGFVPCYPSEINPTYDYLLMIDDTIFTGYISTLQFLSNLHKESRGKIPCKPEFKVVEDEHIVGIMTETNQFVQVTDLVLVTTVMDSLKIMHDGNYLLAETKTVTTTRVDEERVEYIKKIKLETNFFQVFRNTIRILLNDYENLQLREKIEDEINTPYILYTSKLNSVIQYLKDLVGKAVIFVEDYDVSLIDKISTCIVIPDNKCAAKSPVCAVTEDNLCQLVIPQKNLITGKNNEIYYFGRMADEIIRYNRVKSYLFQPDTHLSFGNINYNLHENEIILIQSLLNSDYFVGLEPISENKYVSYNTYDTAEPKQTQNYENRVAFDAKMNAITEASTEVRECVVKVKPNISSSIWSKCFPESFNEIEYEKTNYCGFYLLIDIIKHFHPEKTISLNEMRRELLEQYIKYLPVYESQIIDILILEGKKTLGDQVKEKTLTFQNFIYMDNYYVTNLDIWMIMEKYKIPSIFISNAVILQTKNEKTIFVPYGAIKDKFIFIVMPGLRPETIPKFKIIQSSKGEIAFPVTIFRSEDCIHNVEEAIGQQKTIETFLKEFTKKGFNAKVNAKPRTTKSKTKLILMQAASPEAQVPGPVLELEVNIPTPVAPVLEPVVDPVVEPDLEPIIGNATTKRQKMSVVIKKKQTRKKRPVLTIV